jgi:hypothetical protein
MAAEAVHRGLGGQARAGAGLVERGQQRLVRAQVRVAPVVRVRSELLAHLEDAGVVIALEILERQDVTAGEALMAFLLSWIVDSRARLTVVPPLCPLGTMSTLASGGIARFADWPHGRGHA